MEVSSKRNNSSLLFLLLAIFGCGMLFVFWSEFKTALEASCDFVAGAKVCESDSLRTLARTFIWGSLALPLALLLERIIPAKPNQPLLSLGLRQDIAWWVVALLIKLTVIAGFSYLLYQVFESYLSFLRIDFISSLPATAQTVTVILLADFLAWFHHWVRHKVPFFWEFHKIHHSQREMNYFCDMRIHPMDSINARIIGFIPFYSLDLNTAIPTFLAWEILQSWYTNFSHSNLKTNYGLLRYVLVTPQSHRIHHSIEKRHQDKNFAVVFSIWDFIFRTQHLDFVEYPDTGVDDPSFPNEHDARPLELLKNTIRQIIYPFKFLAGYR